MALIAWILCGLVAGCVASNVRRGEGLVLDIPLRIVGAIVGRSFSTRIGAVAVTGFNLYSMFVARLGAGAVVMVHAIFGQRLRDRGDDPSGFTAMKRAGAAGGKSESGAEGRIS